MFNRNIETTPVAKAIKWFGLAGIIVLVIGVGYGLYQVYKSKSPRTGQETEMNLSQGASIPLATAPVSAWPKLILPPKGKSSNVAVPPDMHIVVTGNNFLVHNVYQDGRECAFGNNCPDGPLAFNYVSNTSAQSNIVSYAFAPK